MNRLVRWLTRPIPLNFVTVIFCFLQGATLSVPAAGFLLPLELFEPPIAVSNICVLTAIGSAFSLPFWSWILVRDTEKGLAVFGLVTGLLIFLGGLLFPAL